MAQVGTEAGDWMLMVKLMEVRDDPHLLRHYQKVSNENTKVDSRFDNSRYRPMFLSHQSRQLRTGARSSIFRI